MGKLSTLTLLKNGLLMAKQFTSGLTAEQAIATAEAIEEMAGLLSLVEGTQAEATSAWTGAVDGVGAIYDGMTIDYRLPYASTPEAATLALSLMGGSTTGAIPVYRDAVNPVTGQFAAGSILRLTYLAASNRWQQSAIGDVALSLSYDAATETLTLSK